jgi:hypothetical protein
MLQELASHPQNPSDAYDNQTTQPTASMEQTQYDTRARKDIFAFDGDEQKVQIQRTAPRTRFIRSQNVKTHIDRTLAASPRKRFHPAQRGRQTKRLLQSARGRVK